MASAAASVIRRGLLYVPASSSKFLEKSLSLTVDTICYDLEDSVTSSRKADARKELRQFLEQKGRPVGVREVAVRINSVHSGLALEDLTEVLRSPHLDAIVIPKVNSASDLHFVTDVIRHVLPGRHPSTPSAATSDPRSSDRPYHSTTPKPLHLLALIESAISLISLPQICPSTPYLSGLIFAAEDFSLDLSLTRTPSLLEMLYARQSLITHARAFKLPSAIDLVCTSYVGEEGQKRLKEECERGREMGFNGKQLIHPSQVGVAQGVFGVGEEEVRWGVRVLVGERKAVEQLKGAWTLDGKMIDKPVIERARAIVQRARGCGVDVGAVEKEAEKEEGIGST